MAGIRTGLRNAALLLQREIKTVLSTYATPRDEATIAPPGGPPGKRTGMLARHVLVDFSRLNDPRSPSVTVGMGRLPYAAIQEHGGTIAARNVRYLPVPVNRRARAIQRRSIGGLRNSGIEFFVLSSRGARFLVEKRSAGKSKDAAVFALKTSVRLPRRPYFGPTARRLRPRLQREIKKAITSAMRAR